MAHPESFPHDGTFEIVKVGQDKSVKMAWGDMIVIALQLKEGDQMVDGWAELMQKPDSDLPKEGDKIEGTLEKNDYGLKLKKKKTGSFGGGGGGYNPGAAFSAGVDQSLSFYSIFKDIDKDFATKIEKLAKDKKVTVKVALLEVVLETAGQFKTWVDKQAGANQPAESTDTTPTKASSESGESDVEIEDLGDGEKLNLGSVDI